MPDDESQRPAGRLARVRLALGALILAVAGLLAWWRPRRRAERARRQHDDRPDRIARLRRQGYEPNDVEVGPVVATGFMLLLLLGGSLFGLIFFLRALTGPASIPAAALAPLEAPVQRPGGALPTATSAPLPARLPVRPADSQAIQTQGEERLHSYGWVDQGAGIVHIPIDRAIDLTVERGLPTREVP